MNMDHDPVLHERYVRVIRVDEAGRAGVAPDVISAFGPVEELRSKSAFQSLRGDLHLGRGSGANGSKNHNASEQEVEHQTTNHELSITGSSERQPCPKLKLSRIS